MDSRDRMSVRMTLETQGGACVGEILAITRLSARVSGIRAANVILADTRPMTRPALCDVTGAIRCAVTRTEAGEGGLRRSGRGETWRSAEQADVEGSARLAGPAPRG